MIRNIQGVTKKINFYFVGMLIERQVKSSSSVNISSKGDLLVLQIRHRGSSRNLKNILKLLKEIFEKHYQ